LIEYFCKPAATISETAGLNELNIAERGIQNLHPISLAFGGLTENRLMIESKQDE